MPTISQSLFERKFLYIVRDRRRNTPLSIIGTVRAGCPFDGQVAQLAITNSNGQGSTYADGYWVTPFDKEPGTELVMTIDQRMCPHGYARQFTAVPFSDIPELAKSVFILPVHIVLEPVVFADDATTQSPDQSTPSTEPVADEAAQNSVPESEAAAPVPDSATEETVSAESASVEPPVAGPSAEEPNAVGSDATEPAAAANGKPAPGNASGDSDDPHSLSPAAIDEVISHEQPERIGDTGTLTNEEMRREIALRRARSNTPAPAAADAVQGTQA